VKPFFLILFAVTLVGAGCHSTPRTTSAELRAKHPEWPSTVNEAVTKILAGMSEADKFAVRAKKKDELIAYHHGWGTGIRNEFGLWSGNYSLLSDCHAANPDGASLVIIEAVWEKLRVQLPRESSWHTADEGTFTVEIPTWLQKQEVHPIDSHCGEYRSPWMRLDFDELYGLGFTPEKGTALHDQFARKFESTPQGESSKEFIKRVGNRFARFKVGDGNPGAFVVDVYIPDKRGGYLSLWITYPDPADTETALRIAKSITFKK